jgi:DNA replication protein DnaC
MLCAPEVGRKNERRIQMGRSIAKFPCVKTLEGFEYDAQPSVDPKQVRELAISRWVANGDSLLLLVPPGVGKTHLAVALGREAIVRGYSTLFVPATGLVTALARAHAEGRLEEKLLHYSKPKLLIVDSC